MHFVDKSHPNNIHYESLDIEFILPRVLKGIPFEINSSHPIGYTMPCNRTLWIRLLTRFNESFRGFATRAGNNHNVR